MASYASLDSAAIIGAGIDRHLAKATARHTMIVNIAGIPTVCRVVLQGSHDGFNWTDIAQLQSAGNGLVNTTADGALVSWVRADLRELVGVAKITATIASDDGT